MGRKRGNAGPRERGEKEKGKGKGFPILIYFLKACFSQIQSTNKRYA
jgi:predicted transcriptional regulator